MLIDKKYVHVSQGTAQMVVGQERNTNVSLAQPSFSFGQMIGALTTLYGVREHERSRFSARVSKIQRAGVPIGTNVGKGPRVRYDLDQFFQLLVALELAELSISLNNAAAMVRFWWPESPLALAPAHAWLEHQAGTSSSILLLASASESEGFAEHPDARAAANAAAGRFIVGAKERPYDVLAVVTADQLIRNGRFDLSARSLNQRLWRTSVVDMSTLVPLVVRTLEEQDLLTQEDFTEWAKKQCEEYLKDGD